MCATSFLISTSTRSESLLRYAHGIDFSFGDMPLDQLKEVIAQCGYVALRREQLKLLVHGRVQVGDGSCAALFASHRSRKAGRGRDTSPASKDPHHEPGGERHDAGGGNHAARRKYRASFSSLSRRGFLCCFWASLEIAEYGTPVTLDSSRQLPRCCSMPRSTNSKIDS